MNKHDDRDVSKVEQATRFGCGALLGLFLGFYVVIKYAFSSVGSAAAIIAAAFCICGYLALKYGDEFWYSIFGNDR